MNKATYYYGMSIGKSTDLFEELDNDFDRMHRLVDFGFLNSMIKPLSSKGEFYWDVSTGYWMYNLHDIAANNQTTFTFSYYDLSNHTFNGNWQAHDDYIRSTAGILFIDNPRSEYTITVQAKIDTGTSGGFGILFDTSVINGSDTGYILQFDRGYGRGSVVIRPRTNGSEGNVIQSHRFDHGNSIIPDKTTSEGALWWNSTHTVRLTITIIDDVPLTKQLSVHIDNQLLFDNFVFQSSVSPANNFTGLRTWLSVGVEFYSLSIN